MDEKNSAHWRQVRSFREVQSSLEKEQRERPKSSSRTAPIAQRSQVRHSLKLSLHRRAGRFCVALFPASRGAPLLSPHGGPDPCGSRPGQNSTWTPGSPPGNPCCRSTWMGLEVCVTLNREICNEEALHPPSCSHELQVVATPPHRIHITTSTTCQDSVARTYRRGKCVLTSLENAQCSGL